MSREVFGVPGGIGFFLFFNVVLTAILSVGLGAVAALRPSARRHAIFCGFIGVITNVIHGVFYVLDPVAFWSPFSFATLGALLLAAIGLLASTP